ncbi:MAG: sodium-independent anion transporter [Deltaproteobacteria bacterium RIFOXYD12_FULL_50_9]|nr:MAG: sodium-independent anion transporter [Deltaproteobacteria bacterium RIFOXYD12_FULL_50_9]
MNLEFKTFFPLLNWWPAVNRRTLRDDLIAGCTGAIIVLPQGVAFATIAGLPPEYGLYSAIVPAIIAALYGSSFHLISGPTTAISIVIFNALSPTATPLSSEYIQMALTISFLAGFFQFILGIARLGTLVNFVSHSVVVGFTAGAAILIATSQVSNLLGITLAKKQSFIHIWADILANLSMINPFVLAVGLATLGIAISLKIIKPRWPGMLIAMVAGSFMAVLMNGNEHGVRLVGALPGHLPPLSSPEISTSSIRSLAPTALAIAMLGLVEAVSIARAIATKTEQRIDSSQEFIGQGLSNIIGSFFSSYASSGSFTRTGVNYEAGAKTPLAAIIAAIALTGILLLIAPLSAYLPIPAMAGILLLVAYNLIDTHHIAAIIKTSRGEAAILGATFLATLFVELEFAIYVGVILSLMLYLNRTSHPHIVTIAPDPETHKKSFANVQAGHLHECPQLKIIRIDGSIFFGAVNHVAEELDRISRQFPELAHILIVGGGINFIDVAGCQMMNQEAHRLRLEGRQIYLCSLKGEVMEIMRRGGCDQGIGQENVFPSKVEAVRKIIHRLDPERCRQCTLRIFKECDQMPKPAVLQSPS